MQWGRRAAVIFSCRGSLERKVLSLCCIAGFVFASSSQSILYPCSPHAPKVSCRVVGVPGWSRGSGGAPAAGAPQASAQTAGACGASAPFLGHLPHLAVLPHLHWETASSLRSGREMHKSLSRSFPEVPHRSRVTARSPRREPEQDLWLHQTHRSPEDTAEAIWGCGCGVSSQSLSADN